MFDHIGINKVANILFYNGISFYMHIRIRLVQICPLQRVENRLTWGHVSKF